MAVLAWLLDADPAMRWQVLRDFVHALPEVVAADRARTATEGWGTRLLALQGGDGQWGVGVCSPHSRNCLALRVHPSTCQAPFPARLM